MLCDNGINNPLGKDIVMKALKVFPLLMLLTLTMNSPLRAETQAIANGKIVKIDYTLTVDGKVADTSEGKAPLEYTQGNNMIIPGLEKQLAGHKAGDQLKVSVPAAEAYGPVNPQLRMEFPKDKIKGDVALQVGMVLQVQADNGQAGLGVIEEVKDTTVTLNFNHPLAGKDLNFDIKIVSVK